MGEEIGNREKKIREMAREIAERHQAIGEIVHRVVMACPGILSRSPKQLHLHRFLFLLSLVKAVAVRLDGAALVGGRGVMVAATDLKSVFRKEVRVRVPPPAPISYTEAMSACVGNLGPENLSITEAYGRLTSDGAAHWPILLDRAKSLWTTEPNFTRSEVNSIKAATMVIVGDKDLIMLEHASPCAALPDAKCGPRGSPTRTDPCVPASNFCGTSPGRWLSLPAIGMAQPSLFACRKSRREIKRLYDFVIGDSGVIIEFLDIRFGACFEETHAPSVIGGEC